MDLEQNPLNMLLALQASSSGLMHPETSSIPLSMPNLAVSSEAAAPLNPFFQLLQPQQSQFLQVQFQLQLLNMIQQHQQLVEAASLALQASNSPSDTKDDEKEEGMEVDESNLSRLSAAQPLNRSAASTPFDNHGDIIVPSNDKEGWCRNKKYIEKVPGGFMCTVCKKIYGRYNSVSYHVTIYHRNPPIRCDIAGCQFSTREARYIHFHKYYRHGIALPTSIDQGSRRCQYCRHVSKSPAMLEKHMKRHQGIEDSRIFSPAAIKEESPVELKRKCDILNCGFEADDDVTLSEHVTEEHLEGRNRTHSCTANAVDDEVIETKERSKTLC